MNWSTELVAVVPLGVVTVISLMPATPGGAVVTMAPSFMTVKVAAVPAKLTALAPVKLAPVMVTMVPPTTLPVLGKTALTEGAEAAL